MTVRIDRCVCFDVSFGELCRTADAGEVRSVTALQAARPFGHQCGLCVPYVREMLRSRRVVFTEILAEDPLADPSESEQR